MKGGEGLVQPKSSSKNEGEGTGDSGKVKRKRLMGPLCRI